MSLRIRLSRGGTKKRPYYHVVVADQRMPRDGRYIERIGHYNPMLARDDESRVKIDAERAKYWLSVGAQPSDRIAKFLGTMGLIDKPATPTQTKQHMPKSKAQARLAAQEEAKKAADEAAKQESEAPAADENAEASAS
ncbi:MAG: 30S ribosomal protein S16 [Pseudomonadota bacterium]